ncbi:hypothetical protein [Actinomadura rayongensis]|uniref:Uncharacterized protein n=1 Tax=Actinomadura rayongensis TaxID=1429076 RepID=A0A6I4W4S6_9ACTN|nr:hypothetical protein [Actinomadura rayongensis]MXQ64451.1 hypothetical protein [Actinomadura rayongensis]
MRFRWDWLEPVVRAPYVPTLGPVPPGAVKAELFDSVLGLARTGRFLRFDKDRRWMDTKDEFVILDEVVHTAAETIVPALTRSSATTSTAWWTARSLGRPVRSPTLSARTAFNSSISASRPGTRTGLSS